MTTLLKASQLQKGMVFERRGDPVAQWWEVLSEFNHGQVTAKPQGSENNLSNIHKVNIGSNAFVAVRDDTWDLK